MKERGQGKELDHVFHFAAATRKTKDVTPDCMQIINPFKINDIGDLLA